jgi:ATP-dependent Clp protease protease subunit
MLRAYWGHSNKRMRRTDERRMDDDNSSNGDESPIKLPFPFQKSPNTYITTTFNHIYFNNDISPDTVFELNKELRNVDNTISISVATMKIERPPIYLHLTTDGGVIYSALSVIDCMNSLISPVYTVIDGFVASAGTLISVNGKKRYMCENAYMLIHELRGGFWGKMTEIDEEYINTKRIMKHIIKIYDERTKIKKKELEGILKKDIIWDIDECINKGLVDEIYKK